MGLDSTLRCLPKTFCFSSSTVFKNTLQNRARLGLAAHLELEPIGLCMQDVKRLLYKICLTILLEFLVGTCRRGRLAYKVIKGTLFFN